MAVKKRNPLLLLAEFILAYLIASVPTSLGVAAITDVLVDARYWLLFKVAFCGFGIIWLYKAGVEVLAEFRDEQAA